MNRVLFIAINFFLTLPALVPVAYADEERMPNMPIIHPKKIYSVPSEAAGADLLEQRGYGDKEQAVKMMNLMMVEGSGYVGMDMRNMKMESDKPTVAMNNQKENKTSVVEMGKKPINAGNYNVDLTQSPAPAQVGANVYEFTVTDPKLNQPVLGLKLKAEVSMTSMDMGTDTPKVKEPKPGHYQVKAVFSMKGPWALKIILPNGERIFPVNAVNSAP
ncbi:MAG: FixH family protein [Cryobacterium sp.]|nr:FixH family protein [Oligoflexia bacterium]